MLIRETARRLAGHRWIEHRLFECTGAWAAERDDADTTRVLAAEARHHAWRASMWDGVVPELHDLDPADVVPPEHDVALLEALAATVGSVERLAGLARVVLPVVLRRYEEDLVSVTEVSDAPVGRTLRLVSVDARADGRAADELLRSSLRTEDEVRRAAARQSELERLLRVSEA